MNALMAGIALAGLLSGFMMACFFLKERPHEEQKKYFELQQHLQEQMTQMMQNFQGSINSNQSVVNTQLHNMNEGQETRLHRLQNTVEGHLLKNIEKTGTFLNQLEQRLAKIDTAQKSMEHVADNVLQLQAILSDKRARGAFGEIQLVHLLREQLPENSYFFQHSLSNGTRVDCMLSLPHPVGPISIDAKFPLEHYQQMMDWDRPESERQKATALFKQDIRKHIQDIQQKYIIPSETADAAIMFLPAESVFAEIHSHFPDLVTLAQRSRVWLASPSTLMAMLTTVRAVFQDIKTHEEIGTIKKHLSVLEADFKRFQSRMGQLNRHIAQAMQDTQDVDTSAQKIAQRFHKILAVELERQPDDFA